MSQRELGDPAPDRMCIDQGEVKMNDGSNPKEYLSLWQSENGFKNGTQVCVVTKEDLERLERNYKLMLNFAFC